jgi:glutamate-ammonia-ligase adenylyltransferase
MTLNRLFGLIRAIGSRASYLALLIENPESLVHLVELTSASSLIATFLARHPVLLDELLDPRTLYAPPDRTELEQELRNRVDSLTDELEYQMDEFRVFRQINMLRVAAADVARALPLMRVSDHLSDLAETIVNQALEVAWHYLVQKHGQPDCKLNDVICEKGFVVIAYGKLGGLELGYGSDLDLVFLHSGLQPTSPGETGAVDSSLFFARLGQRVIHMLTAHTSAGIVYETDMRLRPSGSAGVLVSHIEGFRDYQLNDAWTWEHQALLRSRAIGGDRPLCERFEQVRAEVLTRPRKPETLRQEVSEMRQRMRNELLKETADTFDLKQGIGGMVDVEFLVQYLVLRHANRHPGLVRWTDNVRLLQSLAEHGIISGNTAHLLRHAYLIYRADAHRLSLQEKKAEVPATKYDQLRQRVALIWGSYLGP